MHGRHEDRLVGAGREGDAPLEHAVEEGAVEAVVRSGRRLVEVGGSSVGEEDAEQRADPRNHHGNPGVGEDPLEPGGQTHCGRLEPGVGGIVELFEHRQAGRRRQRIATQRTALVDAAERSDAGHDLAGSPVGPDRQASTDDLAEAPNVGLDAEPLAGAAAAEAEPGDDLVEQQHRADLIAGVAQSLQEAGLGWDHAHVGGNRLDRDHGNGLVELGYDVVRRDDRVGHRTVGHPVAATEPLVRDPAAAGGEQVVAVAVIVARELDHVVATGCSPGESQRRHRCLGAARDEAQHLESRHPGAHLLGHSHLTFGRCAVARAVAGGDCDRIDDGGVGVAEDARPVTHDIVDVPIAFDVPDVGALGGVHEVGRAADRPERPDRRVHAAGHHLFGTLEEVGVGVAGRS